MTYLVQLTPEALGDLARLPIPVQQFCIRQLKMLAESPTALSSRSLFPYPQNCQIFQFACMHQRQLFDLCALFQYGQDELTIFILGIGVLKRPPDTDLGDDVEEV